MIKKPPRRKRTEMDRPFGMRNMPKGCRLCKENMGPVDYKNVDMLRRYITERGKIVPSRISGHCARHQKRLASAIKRARITAILPFVGE